MNKDFFERILELVKDDKELHDATVRLIDSYSELIHERTLNQRAKRENVQKK